MQTQEKDSPKEEKSGQDVPCPSGRNKTAEVKFGDYVIRTYRWPEPEACLRISKQDKLVYSLESAEFKVGGNFASADTAPVGVDLTGRGIPNAVVGEWSGGAHCYFTLHGFELGDHFREVGRIEASNSDTANFVDPNHHGHYEFVGNDWAFAYWNTSFAQSPAPRIVLKFRDGRFRLATDRMTKPGASPQEFAPIASQVKADNEWKPNQPDWLCGDACGIPVSLSKNILELVYTGHSDSAWRLLDESWSRDRQRKQQFAQEFCHQLKTSHYWQAFHDWIGSCSGPFCDRCSLARFASQPGVRNSREVRFCQRATVHI
jgi:hypothetical protein